MTDIAAAIGIEQLKKLEQFNTKRIDNAKILTEGVKDIKGIQVPYVPEGMRHVYHQFTIRAERRDELKAHLEKDMIGAGIYYPRLITENPPLRPFVIPPPAAAGGVSRSSPHSIPPRADSEDLRSSSREFRPFQLSGEIPEAQGIPANFTKTNWGESSNRSRDFTFEATLGPGNAHVGA